MLNIYWLDDNHEREPESRNLGDQISANVDFIGLNGKSLEVELSHILKRPEPNLIIIDHNLEDANLGHFKKGTTAAAFLRETWIDCPIVCVTAENIEDLNTLQKSLYEDVYPFSKISDHYLTIKSIADGFTKLRKKRPQNIEDLLDHLCVPDRDKDKIKSIIPTSLKENFKDNSLLVEISRWVRQVLMTRPGFLYDVQWLSTFIGIKKESFTNVKDIFSDSKFKGIFSSPSNPRYWKSEILDILNDNSELSGLPWEKGRALQGIDISDFSKCYVSSEPFPETVAFIDQSIDSPEEPMKLKYTYLHPDFERLLHFEDIRLMSPAE